MTPAAVLTLQRAVGNQAVARALAQEEHVHGADCGHGTVQREAATETPVEILDAAMSSGSRPIEAGTLTKARSFYQNDRLSMGRVHTGPLAQRAVAAFGAKAMTVGTHIFFGAGVERDAETAGHEIGHLDKNTRGITETGTDKGTGAPVTDPGQHSEREAATDGAAFAKGADLAPSVVTQRALARDAGSTAVTGGVSTAGAAVQRMEDPGRHRRRRHHRRHDAHYEADASASERSSQGADSSPERRALQEQIERELAAGPDLDDLMGRLGDMEGPGLPRVRAMDPQHYQEQAEPHGYGPEPVTEPSEGSSAGQPAEQAYELPENEHLTALRDLIRKELRRGGPDRKLRVTFKVYKPEENVMGGHAWIEVTGAKGKKVSFGFFPHPEPGAGYQTVFNVPGGVHCPDPYANRYTATHRESRDVRLRDIVSGYQFVHSQSEADYNFLMNNCTTFAGEVWTTMTRRSLPREWTAMGMLGSVVSTPTAASEGIEARQSRRRQTRHRRMHGFAQGPARGVIPGGGTVDEVADRLAGAHISQSSSSQSEEVD